jgi:hypothetical protein
MRKKRTGLDPRRVAAAIRNRQKWKGFTPEGLKRVREAMLRFKPWRFSTGPRTPEGKARVAENGRRRKINAISQGEMRRLMAEAGEVVDGLAACRRIAEG